MAAPVAKEGALTLKNNVTVREGAPWRHFRWVNAESKRVKYSAVSYPYHVCLLRLNCGEFEKV
ncbi:hypothetical protein GCM10008018_72400 [Paenibacillus marchantiophytorum]|uniref:Uncharacterized protein n=2 Tax=Paenibacillus marchantiophytorum TaxID=1619310 RepID=A0ABQ1FKB4_9BACL|nr:hypothetical protein GCM10008018_72400 [Paenibacillus marchantiophytorum]